MKEFNKQNLGRLRSEINEALRAVAEKHGIILTIGNIKFSNEEFTTKLTALTKETPDGKVKPTLTAQQLKWQKDFKLNAMFMGLSKTDLGRVIKIGNDEVVIAGCRPRAKNSIVLQKRDGRFIAYSASLVAQLLK